ncbi:hypothetical protein NDU88_000936 [Pleurodeles waltl]|uniref:Uncharacterized protein n=1 Tax=Pleurodeles waltl TaxID=8319 RepID=A0AAV7P6G6_PLEWA|nr:hypothetical protein NDU88_000936 [Pleurodeles waltl]
MHICMPTCRMAHMHTHRILALVTPRAGNGHWRLHAKATTILCSTAHVESKGWTDAHMHANMQDGLHAYTQNPRSGDPRGLETDTGVFTQRQPPFYVALHTRSLRDGRMHICMPTCRMAHMHTHRILALVTTRAGNGHWRLHTKATTILCSTAQAESKGWTDAHMHANMQNGPHAYTPAVPCTSTGFYSGLSLGSTTTGVGMDKDAGAHQRSAEDSISPHQSPGLILGKPETGIISKCSPECQAH